MTKNEAHAHLDRLREGHPMPVALTTEALRITGDISGVFDESLCVDGDESCLVRTSQTQNQRTETGFSYSRYLDCPENQGISP